MKDSKKKIDKKLKKDDRVKKPHHKKQQSGIYNKKKHTHKNKQIESKIEQLIVQAEQAEQVEQIEQTEQMMQEPVEAVAAEPMQAEAAEPVAEPAAALEESAEEVVEQPVAEQPARPEKQPVKKAPKKQRKPLSGALKLLLQTLMAAIFVVIGAAVLLGTFLFVYQPMKENNDVLKEQRLQSRMQLSMLIADVLPSMDVDDEIGDVVQRALESKKVSLRAESNTVANEIETMRTDDAVIAKLIADTGYDTIEFAQIISDADATDRCLAAMNLTVGVLDEKLEKLGVAKLKQEIADFKGTTTTVTREDENGETITETVTQGGLIPEAQAKKNELQKKNDELQAKLTELEQYLDKNAVHITAMYNRLESDQKANDVYGKMKAITAYVKENPKNNIFLQDTTEKLNSFPGESKEEDDILFIMKVEAETGIKMQTVNYGQDYQHKQLSNGMLLCYEVYSIPYYATYQGLKNLIAYFNENDDFYASVYTLSIQYNATNQTIQGSMVILHYYLLSEDAEYVPPTIGEEIIPGIDGIFGEVTDNGKTQGKQSPYTVSDIKAWLDDGMSFEDVRDKLKSEGYPATEFAWIMKEEYKTPAEMQGFLEEYGEEGVEYDLDYVLELLECDLETLMEIYYAKDPNDTTKEEETTAPEEETTGDRDPSADPEDTTGGSNTPVDPEDTTGGGNTPDAPEQTTGGGNNTPDAPEQTTGSGNNTPDAPEDTTGGQTISQSPKAGKQSDYTPEDVEDWMDDGMTLVQVRNKLKAEGYPATELVWILKEKYYIEADIVQFMIDYNEWEYTSIDQAAVLFECTKADLKYIYNY